MKRVKWIPVLLLMLWSAGLMAQPQRYTIKITDTQNQTTLVENASSSSSSSCNSPDFPVMQNGNRTDVNYRDLDKMIVHPERPTSNDEVYVAVELVGRDGKSSMIEMIRNIRLMGTTADGRYSKKIDEIRSVEVIL
jgi:hypothetical protein